MMMPKVSVLGRAVSLTLLILSMAFGPLLAVRGQDAAHRRQIGPDEPGEEEELNRELWEFAKKTPYADALRHISAVRQAERATASTEAGLPTVWGLAPAGRQAPGGRWPYAAVEFAGYGV